MHLNQEPRVIYTAQNTKNPLELRLALNRGKNWAVFPSSRYVVDRPFPLYCLPVKSEPQEIHSFFILSVQIFLLN